MGKMSSMGAKTLGAFGALCIAAVMLIMSTYAWFTISKTPQASKIAVGVTNTQNFEIAKAKSSAESDMPEEVSDNDSEKGQFTWGSAITYDGSAGNTGSGTSVPVIKLELPATTKNKKVQTVKFDDNGRTAGLEDATVQTADENGVSYYKYDDKIVAVALGLWLRTNTEGTISVNIPEIKVDGGKLEKKAIDVQVKLGTGDYTSIPENTDTVIGSLEASKTGTYAEILIYMKGDYDKSNETGVIAENVGGTDALTVTIDNIKFKNSNITDTGSTNAS